MCYLCSCTTCIIIVHVLAPMYRFFPFFFPPSFPFFSWVLFPSFSSSLPCRTFNQCQAQKKHAPGWGATILDPICQYICEHTRASSLSSATRVVIRFLKKETYRRIFGKYTPPPRRSLTDANCVLLRLKWRAVWLGIIVRSTTRLSLTNARLNHVIGRLLTSPI